MTKLLLASILAMTTGAAFAQSYAPERSGRLHAGIADAQYVGSSYDQRPDWYRRWQLRRLYRQRQGYVPDHRACFPGACQDNPYY
jgi:hypothetical protein